MAEWTKLNPKIRNAALAALGAGILAIVNAAYAVYPQDAFVNILYTAVPVAVGYLTKAE